MNTDARLPVRFLHRVLAALIVLVSLWVPPAGATSVNVLTVVPSPGYGYMDPSLQSMLEAQGFTFSEILPTTEITPALLSGVGILFFQETSLNNDPLSPAEVATLLSFVTSGGGLLIVGEAGPDFGPSNLASRAAPFGLGISTVGVSGTITDFTPHGTCQQE